MPAEHSSPVSARCFLHGCRKDTNERERPGQGALRAQFVHSDHLAALGSSNGGTGEDRCVGDRGARRDGESSAGGGESGEMEGQEAGETGEWRVTSGVVEPTKSRWRSGEEERRATEQEAVGEGNTKG